MKERKTEKKEDRKKMIRNVIIKEWINERTKKKEEDRKFKN